MPIPLSLCLTRIHPFPPPPNPKSFMTVLATKRTQLTVPILGYRRRLHHAGRDVAETPKHKGRQIVRWQARFQSILIITHGSWSSCFSNALYRPTQSACIGAPRRSSPFAVDASQRDIDYYQFDKDRPPQLGHGSLPIRQGRVYAREISTTVLTHDDQMPYISVVSPLWSSSAIAREGKGVFSTSYG